jgi:hypothetical protein
VNVADSGAGQVGRLAAGNTFLNASGFTVDDTAGISGAISIIENAAAADGSLVFANLVAEALGGPSEGPSGFRFSSNGGVTRLTGGLFVATDSDAFFSGTNNGRLDAAGDIELTIGQTLNLSQNVAPAEALLSGDNIIVDAGAVAGSGALLLARTDLTITALGDVFLANMSAGDDIQVNAGGQVLASGVTLGTAADPQEDGSNIVIEAGSIGDPASSSAFSAAGSVSLNAASDINLTNVTAFGGDLALPPATITIANSSASNDVLMEGASGIFLGDVSAGRDIRLQGGDVSVSGSANAARLFLARGFNISLGAVSTTGTEPDEEGQSGIIVDAAGAVDLSQADSATAITVSGSTVTAGAISAGIDANVTASAATSHSTAPRPVGDSPSRAAGP